GIDARRPAGGIPACAAQDPVTEPADQSGFLGDRDELARGQQSAHRVAPAQQGLAAADPPARNVDPRLVPQLELVPDQRLAQLQFDRTALERALLHLDVEEAEVVA